MKLLSEIQHRRSAKEFSPEEVDESSLNRILDAGRLAPSAKNRQPWRFIVIQDSEKREAIKNASYGDERFSQAPVAIAACTTNIGYRMPNGELSYPIDLSFAVSFMMLQAEHENLGTSVITTYQEEKIKNLLNIPYSMKIVMILLLGHKCNETDPNVRLPKNRVVAYDHW
ncbi:MAG: nitroreductase [Spirochaetaceae bacterium 4572_59]|nr:MAG: nitroreductase [Spirochaetaceae bacterium 4572_59]